MAIPAMPDYETLLHSGEHAVLLATLLLLIIPQPSEIGSKAYAVIYGIIFRIAHFRNPIVLPTPEAQTKAIEQLRSDQVVMAQHAQDLATEQKETVKNTVVPEKLS